METLNSSTLQAKYTQVALKKESIYESFAYHLIIHVFGAIKKTNLNIRDHFKSCLQNLFGMIIHGRIV